MLPDEILGVALADDNGIRFSTAASLIAQREYILQMYAQRAEPFLRKRVDLDSAVRNLDLSPLLNMKIANRRDKLVMVIDDSSTVRNFIENCLSRKGFEVQGFSDGVEAMQWFTQPEKQVPDLMILDIGLPKMDGYEVARRFKSKPQFSNTIIVMLSRHDGMIDKLKARLVGAKDYLSKPFSTQAIIAMVESHLGVQ